MKLRYSPLDNMLPNTEKNKSLGHKSRKQAAFLLSIFLRLTGSFRTHKKKQKDYMNALEEEVLRLRERESSLNEEAIYWKQCALAVIGSKQISGVGNFQLGPGLFLWTVSNFNDPLSQLLSRPQSPIYSSTTAMSQLTARDALPHTLLQNCELHNFLHITCIKFNINSAL